MKTQTTLDLENAIWRATNKQGVFGCFEVTIGWFGAERVDYMTYDTRGIWRCYEIKATKPDFYSKAHNSFLGHYNYYVMPESLYDEVKGDIPPDIGVYIYRRIEKRSRRHELAVDEQILKNSMIRSLHRYAERQIKSGIPSTVEAYQRENNRLKNKLEQEIRRLQERYRENELELQARRRADRRGLSLTWMHGKKKHLEVYHAN